MKFSLAAGVALLGLASAASAQSPMSTNAAPPPPLPAMAPQPPRAAADMQAVLDAHASLAPLPIETLTPVKAHIQPSAADATRKVMRARGLSTAPDPAVTTQELPYGADAMQYARIYKPAGGGAAPLPVIVYYHGGGWVIADINTYDATPRLLSKQLGALVVGQVVRGAYDAEAYAVSKLKTALSR